MDISPLGSELYGMDSLGSATWLSVPGLFFRNGKKLHAKG